MRASEAGRTPLPPTSPATDRSVDRAIEGRDFDALVRREGAAVPKEEATPSEPAATTTPPRLALTTEASGGTRPLAPSGDGATVALQTDDVPLAPGPLLPDGAPVDEGAALILPPVADALEAKADIDASADIAPPSQPADPLLLLQDHVQAEPSLKFDSVGQADIDPADAIEPNKDGAPPLPAMSSSRSVPQHSSTPTSAAEAMQSPMVTPQAAPQNPVQMSSAFLPTTAIPSSQLETAPPAPGAIPGSASIDTLVPDLAVEVARSAAIGREEFLLRLRPADQGTILVRLQFQGDGPLRAIITADSAAVLQMLRRDTDALSSSLADAGVHTDARSFHFSSGEGGQSRNGDSRQAFGSTRTFRKSSAGEDGFDEATAVYRPLRARAGMVNRLA